METPVTTNSNANTIRSGWRAAAHVCNLGELYQARPGAPNLPGGAGWLVQYAYRGISYRLCRDGRWTAAGLWTFPSFAGAMTGLVEAKQPGIEPGWCIDQVCRR